MGTETVGFYNVNALRDRPPGGVFLDDVERGKAEFLRAAAEGRDPDYDNPGSYAGDVLVSESAARNLLGLPETVSLDVDPAQELPVDTTPSDKATEEAPNDRPAKTTAGNKPKVTSTSSNTNE